MQSVSSEKILQTIKASKLLQKVSSISERVVAEWTTVTWTTTRSTKISVTSSACGPYGRRLYRAHIHWLLTMTDSNGPAVYRQACPLWHFKENPSSPSPSALHLSHPSQWKDCPSRPVKSHLGHCGSLLGKCSLVSIRTCRGAPHNSNKDES